jgi:mannosyltransferase OCH1-like enzyme
MGVKALPARVHRVHPAILAGGLALLLLALFFARDLLYESYTLAALPLLWKRHARSFYLSAAHDGFDVTFANYSAAQTSAAPFEDVVPPVLHHISLGSGAARHQKWAEVRQSCLDVHPGWQAFLWTDETAEKLVEEHFPEMADMWRGYRFPIQKIDALRYMVLYHYGGWSHIPPHTPWRFVSFCYVVV